jgi:8-oxo-dGTP diphosphatase
VSASAESPILAAGGVVWRVAADGRVEVLLVHRPRYDDWSLPKGKADPPDEDPVANALREVEEETGLRCRLGPDLGQIRYTYRGRPKTVRYWAMEVDDGEFVPNREVDRVSWVPIDDARSRLHHHLDADVVDRLAATLGRTG